MQDRLEYIRDRLKRNRVYYSRYNPSAELMYEVEDAGEDMRWMVHEIERLRDLVPRLEP
jgi:RecJ-like exonuclease